MKKIAIVGANSYIARNLYFSLLSKEKLDKIMLYDKDESHFDGADNYCMINILDQSSVQRIDMDCDVIFMFVGKTGSADGFDSFHIFIDINEKGLLTLLNEYRRQMSKAKIIFPSTRLIYKGKKEKQKEYDEYDLKTIYAVSKYACEQYLKQYNLVFGVQYCIFRICIPYGTLVSGVKSYGTTEFMLSKAQKGEDILLYGDGSQRRTLTYIGDLCEELILGALNEKCINDTYNIGGEDYSLKNMAELIAETYGVNVRAVEWPEIALKIESGDTVFDSSKLDRIIQYNHKMMFADWIKMIANR